MSETNSAEQMALLQAMAQEVFIYHPSGPQMVREILRILHFAEPCLTEADKALQNAAKMFLNLLGCWGDTDSDLDMIVKALLGSVAPKGQK